MNLDGNQVWFDDLAIVHTRRDKAEIVQADHYGPFGLMLLVLNWWNPKETVTRQLFNAGSKWQQELQWYSTFYRQYDPQLGRFQQVDPAAESYFSYKPYQYCGNNPVIHNDSLGDKFDVVYRPEHFQLINKKTNSSKVSGEGTGHGLALMPPTLGNIDFNFPKRYLKQHKNCCRSIPATDCHGF